MNHYCTYFDRGFLSQGVALWRSLAANDPAAVLWVLALDDETAEILGAIGQANLRVVPLAELETADRELTAVKATRSRMEYYFTLSPCWPRYLLRAQTEIEALIYIDADMLFLSSPQVVWDELGKGSILLCSHRFPGFLRHYERHGKYNVGVLGWRRNRDGLACLDWWRERCLDWCHERLEADRYADQKYLEQWPTKFGGVVECIHPGVNLAPWNWMNHRYIYAPDGVRVDGLPLVIFHFARFRALAGDWWWQSGHLDYGVMPASLRHSLYGDYWCALQSAAVEIRTAKLGWLPTMRALRLNRGFWRSLPLRVLFGSDWLRVGERFYSGRFGLGRYSGRFVAWVRRIFLRR